ncbi:DUF2939 domain-containing protein [Falsiroseomonas sp. E2-1-a20]|uniref:DUF2939 domain-containing protein n=1 Tax=Falsiroseomonas sp. E2-1-a20 TaxID=3239300 RepID=UPI003F3B2BCF
MASDWNDVWAEYDARHPACPAVPAPAAYPPRPTLEVPDAPVARRRRTRPLLALLVPILGLAWVSAPYATAWQVGHAIDALDPARMSRHLDLPALQSAVREGLDLGPVATETGQAAAFLHGMAQDITAAWAEPAALAQVALARGVTPGAATEALRRTVPIGLTRFEMPLRGHVAPVTLHLELAGDALAPRWLVTGVKLDRMPPLAPAAQRFSALR